MIEKINLKSGKLNYNLFNINENETLNKQVLELKEDLIQIVFNQGEFVVDVGWYPSMKIYGDLIIYIIKSHDWVYPLYKRRLKLKKLKIYLQEAINLADELVKIKSECTRLKVLMKCRQDHVKEKYSFFAFRNAEISYDWLTMYVGRKLDLLYADEVKEFVSEYCTKYLQYKSDVYVKKLSRISKSKSIDYFLEEIMKNFNIPLADESSKEWKLECLKWRYCILNDIKKYVRDNLILWTKVYDVYIAFGSPQDMEYLIKPIYQDTLLKKEFKKLRGQLNAFLKKEKLYIMNEQYNSKN